ncbi:MAG: RDD family protein [Candidatus Eiseniibacteriota bacterium]
MAAAVLYGGFWRRVLAFIVDGLIVGAIMLPFGMGIGFAHLSSLLSDEMTPEAFGSFLMASLFVWFLRVIVSWLYGAGFESSRFQATPGKMLLSLKVTDLEGRRITFLRATGRALAKWVSGLILGIGYLVVAFNDRKQGLHDLLAGTLVRR